MSSLHQSLLPQHSEEGEGGIDALMPNLEDIIKMSEEEHLTLLYDNQVDVVQEELAAYAEEATGEPKSTPAEEEFLPIQPATEESIADCSPAGGHTEVLAVEHSTLGHKPSPELLNDDQVEVHAPKVR